LAGADVISLDDAQARLLAIALPVETEILSLHQAAGRWAADTITAKRTQPARNLSAMDGYAIAQESAPGPWTVIGTSAAGHAFDAPVAKGCAVRIFTGALVPLGCDSVIIQEDVHAFDNMISSNSDVTLGQNVRTAGSDFAIGKPLVYVGDLLTPARIALIAMGGHAYLTTRRRIRVALLSSGDELIDAGLPTNDDQIPSSNALMVAAMLTDLPVDVIDLGIVEDQLDALISAMTGVDADILLTIGGASVGDHDLIRPALAACGANLDFWKVAMRPGKPVMAGKMGAMLVIGLPGNPVSAFVTATLFLLPAIRQLCGASNALPTRHLAVLNGALPATGDRIDHVRGVVADGAVKPFDSSDSAGLQILSKSDALIIRPAGSPPAKSGALVEIIHLT
jgi:molybdopterin molybdotransferase